MPSSFEIERVIASMSVDGRALVAAEDYAAMRSLLGVSGGGLSDGDYGDVTVSGGGTVLTVDDLADKVDAADLATVATTGSAADLSGILAAARVADGSLGLAKLADGSAVSVVGRSANSTGVHADIAAGSDGDVLRRSSGAVGFGSIPSTSVTAPGSSGQVIHNASGAFAGASHVEISSGDLVLTASTPSAPGAGKVTLHGRSIGGRAMPALMSPAGLAVALQPHLGQTKRCEWIVVGNTAAGPSGVGMSAPATTGTATTRNVAAGSVFGAAKRIGYVSSASAGQSAGIRLSVLQFLIGDAAGVGGFLAAFRFGVSDASTVANSRMFVGFTASSSAIANGEPSSLTSIIGVGCDAGETNLSIIHNDGSGSATKVSLGGGSNFPTQTLSADLYELVLYAAPNGSEVGYLVTRLGTAYSASGSLSSNLPANTALLAPQFWRNNGSTALAVGIDILGLYIESDN